MAMNLTANQIACVKAQCGFQYDFQETFMKQGHTNVHYVKARKL